MTKIINKIQDDNLKLSIIQLITTIGNWLSFFAIISAIYQKTGSALTAGYVMAIVSLGQALSGFLIPFVLKKNTFKHILILSQTISIPIVATILILLSSGKSISTTSLNMVFGLYIFVPILDKIFITAIENISKELSDNDQKHRKKQSQLLYSILGSQFVGPIISFGLLWTFKFEVSLIIDLLSYIFTLFLCTRINFGNKTIIADLNLSKLYSFEFLNRKKYSEHLKLLIARSILFYIPVGVFNIFLFDIIATDLKLGIEYSCFFYSSVGLTASLGIKFLRTIDKKDLFPEKYVSCISILALGASTMFYIINPNLIHAIITALLFGFFMGINTLSSQTLRRKLIPAKIFPNFMSIELLIAMSTEWLVAKICVFAGNKYGLTSVTALKFALPFYVLLAVTYLTIKTPKNAVNT